MRIGGTFNGTAADLFVCIGFVPDYVKLWNLEASAQIEFAEWNKHMLATPDISEGYTLIGTDTAAAALTIGVGIQPYWGGDTLTTTTAGTTTYGEGVYLKRDAYDYRRVNSASLGIVGDASSEAIDTWTLDNSSTYRGHFNGDCAGTYIGEGSPICIDGRWYRIQGALSTSGNAASEVYLSYPAKSGSVEFIGGMYDYKPMVAGDITPAGFWLDATLAANINDETVAFEAGTYN